MFKSDTGRFDSAVAASSKAWNAEGKLGGAMKQARAAVHYAKTGECGLVNALLVNGRKDMESVSHQCSDPWTNPSFHGRGNVCGRRDQLWRRFRALEATARRLCPR